MNKAFIIIKLIDKNGIAITNGKNIGDVFNIFFTYVGKKK